jgi:histidinol dehydrogenase
MKVYDRPDRSQWPEILKRPLLDVSELSATVGGLLNTIRLRGEEAVRELTLLFDGVAVEQWEVTSAEIERAEELTSPELKEAMARAAENIATFHRVQLHPVSKMETMPGVWCWQKPVAIEKVGLYIPGGSAPLFSTVLMLGVPARLAGCREIILCTPPGRDGTIPPAILTAARIAGVHRVFRLGGVQAIGAMAYGVVTPKVDKIFGPGNQYVMAAKQLVSLSDVAVDMPAGPSEVAIMADESSEAAFVAADLLSQAEHGPDSQVLLLLRGSKMVPAIEEELAKQLERLPRREIAAKALENSRIVIFDSDEEMVSMINHYAPEHLIIATGNYSTLAPLVTHAGSVFLGNYTPESAGDYASGPNHTLPTNGWARSFSGVNMDSFVRKITFQEITNTGLKNLGPVVEVMAAAEELEAHRNAVTLRLDYLKKIGR